MKYKLLLIIIFCIFSTLLINAQSEENIIKETSNEKYWKRHFFDLCLIGGFSLGTSSRHDDEKGFITSYENGGLIGASFGYQYAFTDKFAFGPGFSAFLNIRENGYYHDIYHDNNHTLTYTSNRGVESNFGAYNAATIMFMFMIGDLKNEKVAFLIDIGGGILFSAKFGLYVKGFIIKTGYTFSGFPYDDGYTYRMYYGHHITFDIGYKFNWKNKFEGKLLKK